MKAFKKLLIGIMAAMLVLGSVMTVSANQSYDTDITVPEDSTSYGYYIVLPIFEENFVGKEDLCSAILGYNADALTVEELFSDSIPGVDGGSEAWNFIKSNNLIAFTDVFDVKPVGDAVNNETHEFALHIPTLTKDMKIIRFLHFSLEKGTWEILAPVSVDYDKQIIVLKTDDLSPMIGFYATSAATGNSTQAPATTVPTSPKTAEVASNWMLWMAAAVVLVAAGTVVVKRKYNK